MKWFLQLPIHQVAVWMCLCASLFHLSSVKPFCFVNCGKMQSSKSDSRGNHPIACNDIFITQCCFVRPLIQLLQTSLFYKMWSIRIAVVAMCATSCWRREEKNPSKWLCYSNAAEMSTITSNKVITILLVHTEHIYILLGGLFSWPLFKATKIICNTKIGTEANKKQRHTQKVYIYIYEMVSKNRHCSDEWKMLSTV